MPATSEKQRRAAYAAMNVKQGKGSAQPGSPAAKMAQMPVKSLQEFTRMKNPGSSSDSGSPGRKGKSRGKR